VMPWSIQGITFVSGLGVVIGAAYLLWMLQRVFFGPIQERWTQLRDATGSEVFVLATLAVLVLAFGFSPQWLTRHFESDVTTLATQYQDMPKTAVLPEHGPKHPLLSAIGAHKK